MASPTARSTSEDMRSLTLDLHGVTLHQTGHHCAVGNLVWQGGYSYAVVGGSSNRKSSIGRFLVGIASPREITGDVLIDGTSISELTDHALSQTVAYLPSNPQLVFSGIRRSVRDEALLTLQFLNTPKALAQEMVLECAELLGIGDLLDRDPYTLSGGESALAAVAVSVVKQPAILVLDQSYDSLDPDTRLRFHDSVARLQATGALIVELHNRTPPWIESFESCVFIDLPHVVVGPYRSVATSLARSFPWLLPPAAAFLRDFEQRHGLTFGEYPATPDGAATVLQKYHARHRINDLPKAQTPTEPTRRPVLVAKNLKYRYPAGNFTLGPIPDFAVFPGDLVSLIGPNGAGKTTLLRALALLLEAEYDRLQAVVSGSRELKDPPRKRRRHEWARSVMYCFQHPADQLWANTVRSELLSAARLAGVTEASPRFQRFIDLLDLGGVLDDRPLDLSASHQKLTTIATCLIAGPPILLLDEPTAGLDSREARRLSTAIAAYLETGGACLMVSHDIDFVCDHSRSLIAVSDGQVRPQSLEQQELSTHGFVPTNMQIACRLTQSAPTAASRFGKTEFGGRPAD